MHLVKQKCVEGSYEEVNLSNPENCTQVPVPVHIDKGSSSNFTVESIQFTHPLHNEMEMGCR